MGIFFVVHANLKNLFEQQIFVKTLKKELSVLDKYSVEPVSPNFFKICDSE